MISLSQILPGSGAPEQAIQAQVPFLSGGNLISSRDRSRNGLEIGLGRYLPGFISTQAACGSARPGLGYYGRENGARMGFMPSAASPFIFFRIRGEFGAARRSQKDNQRSRPICQGERALTLPATKTPNHADNSRILPFHPMSELRPQANRALDGGSEGSF